MGGEREGEGEGEAGREKFAEGEGGGGGGGGGGRQGRRDWELGQGEQMRGGRAVCCVCDLLSVSFHCIGGNSYHRSLVVEPLPLSDPFGCLPSVQPAALT